MKKVQFCGAIMAAVFLGAFFGCQKTPEAKRELKAPAVKVSAPKVADVQIKNAYSAKAVAYEQAEIRARVGGYLEKSLFKKGGRVKKDEILFKIDDRPYSAALAAADARVKAAESQIGLAQSNAERTRVLIKTNAVSEEAYQTRETQLLVAKAKLLEAKAAQRKARLDLEYTNVRAPMSGKVGEALVDEGNLVAAQASLLARIVDDSKMRIYFELNGADAARYRESGLLSAIDKGDGAAVEFRPKNGSKTFKGKLCYYDNALGAGTASLIMRADIDNPDGALMSGSYGDIVVMEGVRKNALLLPEEAIGTDLTGRFVWVVDDSGTAWQRQVKLGEAVGNMRVIQGGLSKGDRVVVKGLQRAAHGKKLSPENIDLDSLQ